MYDWFTLENSFYTGCGFVGFVAATWLCCWVFGYAWWWVDDKEGIPVNKLDAKMNRGWVSSRILPGVSTYWNYYKNPELFDNKDVAKKCRDARGCEWDWWTNGVCCVYDRRDDRPDEVCDAWLQLLGIAFLSPILLWLCVTFWEIALFFVSFWAIAHTARMGRRGQKALTKHMEDKEAHK